MEEMTKERLSLLIDLASDNPIELPAGWLVRRLRRPRDWPAPRRGLWSNSNPRQGTPGDTMSEQTVVISCSLIGDGGNYRLVVCLDRQPYLEVGPFETEAERARVYDRLVVMLKRAGGQECQPTALQ